MDFFTTTVFTALLNFWVIRNNAELISERSKVEQGAKLWDKIILGLSGVSYLISVVLAGFDSGRFHWSPSFRWTIYAAGVAMTLAGQILFLGARKENNFFSSVVRIQTDRGQTVCDTGVYKLVRHPGYSGMILSLAAIPLQTGSVWSFIPIAAAIILLFVRPHLEDETLKKELSGYTDYAEKTKQRLIPKIW